MIVAAIGQGMLLAVAGLGIYMTFRVLKCLDFTSEISFSLGGVTCLLAILAGIAPIYATLLALLAGMSAGLLTGILAAKGKIATPLASFLVMVGVQTTLLTFLKKSQITPEKAPKLHDAFAAFHFPPAFDTIFLGLIVLTFSIVGLLLFFYTLFGQAYLMTGANEALARSLGIATHRMKMLGFSLANGLIALSGALIAQQEGTVDLNQRGIFLIGIVIVLIGELLFGELTRAEQMVSIVVGSILYQLALLLCTYLGYEMYVPFVPIILLLLFFMLPSVKRNVAFLSEKGESQ